jgi:hypothetical protein
MRSIERRFNNLEKRNPKYSSYLCFAETVNGHKFSKQMVHRWFQKLVEKDDYDGKDKKAILRHLESL